MDIDRNTEPTLAVDEIQGDILVGLQKDFEWFIGFNIDPTKLANFKSFLRERLAPVVTTTRQALQHEHQINSVKHVRPKVTLNIVSINVGFSFKGLNTLKVPGLNQISDEPFKGGLAAASASLGDPTDPANEGNPGKWKVGGTANEVDGLLLITGPSRQAIDLARSQLEHFAGTSWSIVYAEVGTTRFRDRGHEHFGFLDAVSQPGIRGQVNQIFPPQKFLQDSQNPEDPAQGLPGSDLLWPGEFVFGYPQQDNADINGKAPDANGGQPWMNNGSFMAFRRLKQLVPEFDAFVETTADTLNMDSDLLGARLVGRWKSGAPVSITPLQDDPELADDELKRNDFEFDNDPQGRRCPFAAHIRKAYPRNDITPGALGAANDFERRELSEADTQTHRILRRGIPFGPDVSDEEKSVPDGTVPTTKMDRGLMFVSYQTSLDEQFQFLQRNWFNNPEFAPRGQTPGFDPLLGQTNNNAPRPFQGALPNFPSGLRGPGIELTQEFIVPTGGGYFFMPSISALRGVLGA